MAEKSSFAVLGTGAMGTGIALSLLREGHRVTVWNRTIERARPLADRGATVVETPDAAVRATRIFVTMLADGDATEAVARQVLPAAKQDTIWVQMATIGIQAIDRVVELARDAGVAFVDAPVLGTREPAERGELVVLASGSAALREPCAPLFDAVGKRTLWVGQVPGMGQRVKLVVNTWLLGIVGVLGEVFVLADALGVDPSMFFEALRDGPLDVPYAHVKGDEMLTHKYPTSFSVRMAAKDGRLIQEAARAVGRNVAITATVRQALERAAELGHADDDFAALYEALLAG
jgi:3-hydroxyisobutyrate dehydrogenase